MSDVQSHELTPIIKIAGSELSTAALLALLEVRVERALQVPARCTLRLVDDGYRLASSGDYDIGKDVEISILGGGQLFKGEITDIEIGQALGEHPELVLTAYDRSHRLGRDNKVRAFVNVSYSEIVNTVVKEAGLKSECESMSQVYEEVVQAGTTVDLLNEICRRTGFDWLVEDGTLKFFKPKAAAAVKLVLGESLSSFSVRAANHFPDSVVVRGWDPRKKVAVVGKANKAAVLPSSAFAGKALKGMPFGSSELLTAQGTPGSEGEAKEISQALLDRAHRAAITAVGVAMCTDTIKPGGSVQVDNAGPASGTYHVTAVEHLFGPNGTSTRFTAGDRVPSGLVDGLGGGGRSGAAAVAPSAHDGLVVGIVTNIKDDELLGRVKVKFPTLSEEVESDWCRVAAIGAGQGYGSLWVPEVNDEVLVGFEGGNLRRPIVLGGLYNGKAKPPKYTVNGEGRLESRRIASRMGHLLEMIDTDGDDQQIMLQHVDKKTKVLLNRSKLDIEAPTGSPITIKMGEQTIVITNNDIAIKSTGSITLDAKTNVTIKAGANVQIEATASFEAKGNATAKVSGTVAEVSASGPLTLKGAIVQIN